MSKSDCMFSNCFIHIISKCIGPKRSQLFKTQIITNGGVVCTKEDASLTHVVYDESLPCDDPDFKHFLALEKSVKIVGTKWLSECLKTKKLAPEDAFLLRSCKNKRALFDERIQLADEELPSKKSKIEESIIAGNSTVTNLKPNNENIIAELSKLAKTYQNLGEVYRARHYSSAVSVIQKYHKEICSYEEALAIPGITSRMATKIEEILEMGYSQRAAELNDSEKMKVVEVFTQIWGVGPATADSWYRQGLRTLEDVKNKCTLTKMQQTGLKYYYEFQKPIPRKEVEKISEKVTEVAISIDATIKSEICGSYRRGKELCGDVDVVIFENNEDHSYLMGEILKKLININFVSSEFKSLETYKHHKFLGICKLPGENSTYRRLDIFIAPIKEYAAAMIHYTGSANFNIALRQHAMKKGMHLSENGLFDKIVRQGNSVSTTGAPLPTPTEESIFKLLGLPFRSPEERESRVIFDEIS